MRCKLEKYTQPLELAIKNKASCVFPFSLPLHSCLGGHVIQLTGSWDGRYPDSTVTFWQNLLKRNTQHTSGFVWARNKYPLCLTLKLGVIYYISYQYSPWLIPDMSMFLHQGTCARMSLHACLVAQSCPTLCSPMDCACQGSLSMGFPRKEYCSGLPFPPPGDLPKIGIEPRSPACPTLHGVLLSKF